MQNKNADVAQKEVPLAEKTVLVSKTAAICDAAVKSMRNAVIELALIRDSREGLQRNAAAADQVCGKAMRMMLCQTC